MSMTVPVMGQLTAVALWSPLVFGFEKMVNGRLFIAVDVAGTCLLTGLPLMITQLN
jgi:hypothetical protein